MKLSVPFLITLFSLCFSYTFSQSKNDVPDFGQIDKKDLQLNECDFDKNAEALVLFDVENVVCKIYTYMVYSEIERHIRIKILKNKGQDQANIKIPYYSGPDADHMEITGAQTYNLDGSGNVVVTRLDKKAIVDKQVNKKISEKIFSFPDARTGSVIEYTYKLTGSISTGLRNWNFQSSVPVKLSRYTLKYPADISINCRPQCTLPVDEQNFTEKSNYVKVFTMTNLPALREEPYMTCEADYMQHVEPEVVAFTVEGRRHDLTHSLPEIVNMFMNDEDFGQQLTKNIPGTENLESNLKAIKDPYQKMTIIYRYVRDNMYWNGQYNIWAPDGVKTAWKNRKGTDGEINLILVNLLKGVRLDTKPILVSTRSNGRVNTSVPDWHQFDKVMAYVVINDHTYILDATEKFAPPNLIPSEVMYSEGLVVDKLDNLKWGWRTLWDEHNIFNELIQIHGVINDQGMLNGDATIKSKDYSRVEKMANLKKGKEQFAEKYFSSKNPAMHMDSMTINNEEVDTLPLLQKLWFNAKLSSSGNYKYFSTNLFTGFEENPFLSDRRFSDVFFGANQDYTILENFIIPAGYVFDEMPKNVKMIMPDTSIVFTRIIETHDNLMNMRITLEFRKPVFGVDEYEVLRMFYKKMFDMLSEQIILKKS